MIAHLDKCLNCGAAVQRGGSDTAFLMALVSLLVIAIGSLPACMGKKTGRSVMYEARTIVFANGNAAESMQTGSLIVTLGEDRSLSLNKFETGSIADPWPLTEKLKAVFADRRRSGSGTEVIIELRGSVDSRDLEELIRVLEPAGAERIRIVRNEGE